MASVTRPAIHALLIDLSGTLHIGSNAIEGSVPALQRLRTSGMPIRFCSNASKESTTAVRKKLLDMGFEVNDGELWTSLGTLKEILKTKGVKKCVFCLRFPLQSSIYDPLSLIFDMSYLGHSSFYPSLPWKNFLGTKLHPLQLRAIIMNMIQS